MRRLLLLLLFFLTGVWASCEQSCRGDSVCTIDSCGSVSCNCTGNGQWTSRGCLCAYGFTGDHCEFTYDELGCGFGTPMTTPEWLPLPVACGATLTSDRRFTANRLSPPFPVSTSVYAQETHGPFQLHDQVVRMGVDAVNSRRIVDIALESDELGLFLVAQRVPRTNVFTLHSARFPSRTLHLTSQLGLELSAYERTDATRWRVTYDQEDGFYYYRLDADSTYYLNTSGIYTTVTQLHHLRAPMFPSNVSFTCTSVVLERNGEPLAGCHAWCLQTPTCLAGRFNMTSLNCRLCNATIDIEATDLDGYIEMWTMRRDRLTAFLTDERDYLTRTFGWIICDNIYLCIDTDRTDPDTLFSIKHISPNSNEVFIMTADETRMLIVDPVSFNAYLVSVYATRHRIQSFFLQNPEAPLNLQFTTLDQDRLAFETESGYLKLSSASVYQSRFDMTVQACLSNPCQNGGTCNPLYDSMTCTCAAGYSGSHCQTNVDECSSTPCENGATCHDGLLSYNCVCAHGFSGVRCQTELHECASDPCQNSATCNEQVNGYVCLCTQGYSGVLCQTNIDECESNPCQNSGTCIDE